MRGAQRHKGGGRPGQKTGAPAEFVCHVQGVSFFFGHGAAYGQSLRLAAKRCQAGWGGQNLRNSCESARKNAAGSVAVR
jgi:hypothetical protein